MSAEPMVITSFQLPVTLYQQVKQVAAGQQSMGYVIREALTQYLALTEQTRAGST